MALFAPNGLYEFPLIGQRLVWPAEIGAGLDRVFAILDNCTIELAGVKASGSAAIAEGRLQAKVRRGDDGDIVPALASRHGDEEYS